MIFILTLGLVSLIALSRAAPHINHLEERQRDKTYTITCLGPQCTDYPPTEINTSTLSISLPPGVSKPTTSAKITSTKISTSPTSRKVSSTSKYTTPPDPPTKTITVKPSTTKNEETGPSSTSCPVPLYYQCGGYYDGKPWTGCKKCVSGAKCVQQNEFYYQCVADE